MNIIELNIRNKKKSIDIDSFLNYCSEYFKVHINCFVNNSRNSQFVEKRIIIYKILTVNGYTQQQIADKLNRERSVISVHLNKFQNVHFGDLHFEYEKFLNDFVKSDFWAKTKKTMNNYDAYKTANPFDKENVCQNCGEPCEKYYCEVCLEEMKTEL